MPCHLVLLKLKIYCTSNLNVTLQLLWVTGLRLCWFSLKCKTEVKVEHAPINNGVILCKGRAEMYTSSVYSVYIMVLGPFVDSVSQDVRHLLRLIRFPSDCLRFINFVQIILTPFLLNSDIIIITILNTKY